MNPLRRIHLLGGPDAHAIKLMDADTGKLIEGVVKVELLLVPGGGALVNITQACQLMGINLVATDAGQPLIDLPDDEPVRPEPPFAGAAALGELSPDEQKLADTCAHFGVELPREKPRSDSYDEWCKSVGVDPGFYSTPLGVTEPSLVEHVAEVQKRIAAAMDVPAQAVRPTSARSVKDRTVPGAPLDVPPPLPEVPKAARRAPPPEPEPEAPPEPDLSQDEKDELVLLMSRATAATPLQLQQVNSAGWPFPTPKGR